MRRLLTGLLGASLLLGACSDDGDDDRAAVTSIPDQTSSTTTTEKPAIPPPDVIPTDTSLITEEYVEQVLDALYEVSLEAALAAREDGDLVESSIRLIEATSTPKSAANRITSLAEDVADGFADYHSEPQAVDADVIEVLEASPECILAEAKFDSSGMVTTPDSTAGFRIFARLRAATAEQRSSGLNPTAWVLDELPATDDGSIPSGCNQ